jgi:hypothetical protein
MLGVFKQMQKMHYEGCQISVRPQADCLDRFDVLRDAVREPFLHRPRPRRNVSRTSHLHGGGREQLGQHLPH